MTRFFLTDQAPSRYVRIDGKTYLWFSGTDYLGMSYHPVFLKLLSENLEKAGAHFGSSRNNTLRIRAYEDAESALARFTGAEDALLVSSGMLAGFLVRSQIRLLARQLFPSEEIEELEAPGLHPALTRLPQSFSDWNDWAGATARLIDEQKRSRYHILYSDAIGSPQTTAFDFAPFHGLPDTLLVVDDSHGLGVLGSSGEGSFRSLQKSGIKNLLVIASLNKAMGAPGGVILGERSLLDGLRQTPGYSGASPIAPAYAAAIAAMVCRSEYQRAHARLTENISFFYRHFEARDHFSHLADYPVYTTTDSGLFDFLRQREILSSSFSYPTRNDPLLTRLVVTAAHTRDDLLRLAEVCSEYYA